jgi:hypothetical protein
MAIPGGNMTRTKTIATLWCTALAAALAAYGCGSSSTIDTGMGGTSGGAGGKTGGGTGGGIVIINTGGMTGSGGMTGGGMGGMVMPPQDAGPPMCMPNAMCTAPFMCDGTCRANGQNGTRACMCGMNGRLACGACMVPDAGAPPPPVDAGPRPDAGPACPGNARNNGPCMLGMSPSPCARMAGGGGMMQTCTCAAVPPPDGGASDAGGPPPPTARYTCM